MRCYCCNDVTEYEDKDTGRYYCLPCLDLSFKAYDELRINEEKLLDEDLLVFLSIIQEELSSFQDDKEGTLSYL